MEPNKEQILDLIKSRTTNYKDYKGNQRSYVPDDDYEYIADKILTLMQSNSDSQPNGRKPRVSGAFAIRSKIAKEAYKRYIGDNSKLSIQNIKEANAFCEGARFQRLHGK